MKFNWLSIFNAYVEGDSRTLKGVIGAHRGGRPFSHLDTHSQAALPEVLLPTP